MQITVGTQGSPPANGGYQAVSQALGTVLSWGGSEHAFRGSMRCSLELAAD